MDGSINNEIRPSISSDDLDGFRMRLSEQGITASASIKFAEWVTEITVTDPQVLNEFRLLHHLERYWFTAEYLAKSGDRGITYFDIGLGEAHGTMQLLQRSPVGLISRVSGIEIAPDIADTVSAKYPQIDVHVGNILEVEISGVFDVISCFELVGNESLSSDEALMKRLDQMCAPGGRLFVSIAAFGSTAHGRKLSKDYNARIHDNQSFEAMMRKSLPNYKLEFFGQIYPLKRMFASQVGVWPNPDCKYDTDFLICVAWKAK